MGDDAVVSAPVSAPQGRVLHRPGSWLPAVFGATAAFFAETVSDLFPPLVTMVVYWKRRNWIIQEAASHRRLESDAQTAVQQPAALGQAQAI